MDIRTRLASSRLYLCTDARKEKGDFEKFINAAFEGGVDVIQLRDKKIDAVDELRQLEILARVAEKYGALWAVNDRADIARIVGAPILHVGQNDLSVLQSRQIIGHESILGRSSHSEGQSREASLDAQVDYFAVGPCWPTPTKPGRTAPGLSLVEYVASLGSSKPWFAIGGIDATNIAQVRSVGGERIVVVRAITNAEDPTLAAKKLRSFLN